MSNIPTSRSMEIVTRIEFMPFYFEGMEKNHFVEELRKILDFKNKNNNLEYAYIIHDKDIDEKGDLIEPHVHIALKFTSARKIDYVAKWFDLSTSTVEKVKGKWVDVLQYLTHANSPQKHQYDLSEVKANFDFETIRNQLLEEKNKNKRKNNNYALVEEYIERIDKGEIREYNQFELIPNAVWSRNKTVILNALQFYKERIAMQKNRNINVMFIYGGTGSGKTSYAKSWCEDEKRKFSYCISSSSNDVMQDYKGEDVLILDDLRDDSFTFTDLLKVLDNHTKSSVKSRYANKHFLGHTIIITSSVELKDWYKYEAREDRLQLYRRIKLLMKIREDGLLNVFLFNQNKYEFKHTLENEYRIKEQKQNEDVLAWFGLSILDNDLDDNNYQNIANKNRNDSHVNKLEIINDDNPFDFTDEEIPF